MDASPGTDPRPLGDTIRDLKREAILDAARRVFERDGLAGATMRGIAAQAGCTTGAIYSLFDSKEAVYAELLAASLAGLHARVSRAVGRAAPGRAHDAAARAFLAYYLERPYEVALGLYAFDGLQRRGVGDPLNRRLNGALSATLALLAPGPVDAPPGTDAMTVFAQLIGALVLHRSGRLRLGRASPAALLDRFLDLRRRAAPTETPA